MVENTPENNYPGQLSELVPFEPADFDLHPEIDETDEAMIAMSCGDFLLFALERELSDVEQHYNANLVGPSEYYRYSAALFESIDLRRAALGFEPRPRP